MKKRTIVPGILIAALALLLTSGCASQPPAHATASPAASRPNGISDAEIRDIVERVARHNDRPLAEGVSRRDESCPGRSATPPEGITWVYPHGVMLYGMEHSTEVTGDTNVDQLVANTI